jgi:hypothetical protein
MGTNQPISTTIDNSEDIATAASSTKDEGNKLTVRKRRTNSRKDNFTRAYKHWKWVCTEDKRVHKAEQRDSKALNLI